jgi:predicted alpha/beta-fold hydrolase
MAMSKVILEDYSEFPSLEAYFDQYTLMPDRLRDVSVPTHIIASLDDPVVADGPYESYYALENVYFSIQRRGGHMGFVGPLLRTSWYEKVILRLMNDGTGTV